MYNGLNRTGDAGYVAACYMHAARSRASGRAPALARCQTEASLLPLHLPLGTWQLPQPAVSWQGLVTDSAVFLIIRMASTVES